MKLEYRYISPLGYYIILIIKNNVYVRGISFTKFLNINYTELINIITRNNGFYSNKFEYIFMGEGYYFHTLEDADAAIEALIPYLILTTLTE